MHSVTQQFGESRKTLGATGSLFLDSEVSQAHRAPANNSSRRKQAVLLTVCLAGKTSQPPPSRFPWREGQCSGSVGMKSGSSSSPVPFRSHFLRSSFHTLKGQDGRGCSHLLR